MMRSATRGTGSTAVLLSSFSGVWERHAGELTVCEFRERMDKISCDISFSNILQSGIRPHVQPFGLESMASVCHYSQASRSQAHTAALFCNVDHITQGYNVGKGLAPSRYSSTSDSQFSYLVQLFNCVCFLNPTKILKDSETKR